MSLPFTADIVRLKNNNPGNAPDYTEHDFISLRRYNGEPLNHTQADDNLELLRRAVLGLDANVRHIDQRVINIDENFIQQLFDNQVFQNLLNNFINNSVNTIIEQIINSPIFNDYMNQFNNQYFNQNFQDYFNQYIDEADINVTQEIDLTEVQNLIDARVTEIVQVVDIEAIVKRLQNYVNQQIELLNQAINVRLQTMETVIQSILDLLDSLVDGGDVDFSEIIALIQELGANIAINADNIALLSESIQQNTEAINGLVDSVNDIIDAVNDLGKALQDLSKAMKDGFDALNDWIQGIFKDITNAIADLGDQIAANADQIADLWDFVGQMAQDLWNAIGQIWGQLDTVFEALKDLEALICELDLKVNALKAFVDAIGIEFITICEGGSTSDLPVLSAAQLPDTAPGAADLQGCGGPTFEKMLKEQQKKDAPARFAREEKRRQRDEARKKAQGMKQFQRDAKGPVENLRKAVNNAQNRGFQPPAISTFIHNFLTK